MNIYIYYLQKKVFITKDKFVQARDCKNKEKYSVYSKQFKYSDIDPIHLFNKSTMFSFLVLNTYAE